MRDQRQRLCTAAAKTSTPVVERSLKVVVFRCLIWDTAVLLLLSRDHSYFQVVLIFPVNTRTLLGQVIRFGNMYHSSDYRVP